MKLIKKEIFKVTKVIKDRRKDLPSHRILYSLIQSHQHRLNQIIKILKNGTKKLQLKQKATKWVIILILKWNSAIIAIICIISCLFRIVYL